MMSAKEDPICQHIPLIPTPGLKEALKDSLEPVKCLLHSLFSRLKLKVKSFKSFNWQVGMSYL